MEFLLAGTAWTWIRSRYAGKQLFVFSGKAMPYF
jgi:hypothetical protein